jgi:hypothetical protein
MSFAISPGTAKTFEAATLSTLGFLTVDLRCLVVARLLI